MGEGRLHVVILFKLVSDGKRRVWVGEKVSNEIRHLTAAEKIVASMNPPEDEEGE